MESDGALKVAGAGEAERPETKIEIKLKTLDSQTYTLRVDKQMPVPSLKEQIASVTGVLSEQQRLICRGRVLKDDQLLSAYHVEDGHTLHLVVRQPVLQSSNSLPNDSATFPASTTDSGHTARSVVIEAFSMPDQGDGVPPEINRIVSAVVGSLGFPNIGSGIDGVDVERERDQQRSPAATATGTQDATLQPDQVGIRVHSDRSWNPFGFPTSVSLGSLHPPMMPDSLATLSHYRRHLGRDFSTLVTGRASENVTHSEASRSTEQRDSNSTSGSGTAPENLPTPSSLSEVLLSSRQFINEQVSECLQQLAGQLETQTSVTDSAVRFNTQCSAWRTGVQLYNLGAFMLELGRTIMTLRLGQAPSEALVNAGPAVFISPSAPNPLMVQPLPFHPRTSFGTIPVGSMQHGSGLVNGIGPGFLPRRIDIQIRRGSSSAQYGNPDERGDTPNPSGLRNNGTGSGSENLANQTTPRVIEGSLFGGESGVRVVPIRTMVALVRGSFRRLPSDSSSNSMGLYCPVLGRFQHVASGNVNGAVALRSETTAENHSAGVQNQQQSTSESNRQQQNAEPQMRDGSLQTFNSRQNNMHIRHRLSSSGTQSSSRIRVNHRAQTNSEDERLIHIIEFARDLALVVQGLTTGSMSENARQRRGAEPNIRPEEDSQAETSDVGASNRSDQDPRSPNSKRQKRE